MKLDGGGGGTFRQFLRDSLEQLGDRIPLREMDVSDRLDEETLALSYLYLRDEFGAGELSGTPGRPNSRAPLPEVLDM